MVSHVLGADTVPRVDEVFGSAVTLLMKAQFSGALLEAEEKPADTHWREGVSSVNSPHELEVRRDD